MLKKVEILFMLLLLYDSLCVVHSFLESRSQRSLVLKHIPIPVYQRFGSADCFLHYLFLFRKNINMHLKWYSINLKTTFGLRSSQISRTQRTWSATRFIIPNPSYSILIPSKRTRTMIKIVTSFNVPSIPYIQHPFNIFSSYRFSCPLSWSVYLAIMTTSCLAVARQDSGVALALECSANIDW